MKKHSTETWNCARTRNTSDMQPQTRKMNQTSKKRSKINSTHSKLGPFVCWISASRCVCGPTRHKTPPYAMQRNRTEAFEANAVLNERAREERIKKQNKKKNWIVRSPGVWVKILYSRANGDIGNVDLGRCGRRRCRRRSCCPLR